MFKTICGKIERAKWEAECERYIRLDCFDRMLDGTFYNHLKHNFYQSVRTGNSGKEEIIPLDDRRPSAQFRLPRMVARQCARKLFAGRHLPKIKHPQVAAQKEIQTLVRNTGLFRLMREVVIRGSVGSVAVTFRVDLEPTLAVVYTVWKAKDCEPSFDKRGELAKLRVAYVTTRQYFESLGASKEMFIGDDKDNPKHRFWFVKDYTPLADILYMPVEESKWNPVNGDASLLRPWPDYEVEHNLGFVQGHWFVNLSGGCAPDGACTFEDAIPNSIDLDYNMAQTGRGVRYNATPQLVTIGPPENDLVRSPEVALIMSRGHKTEDGDMIQAGDAKLLEMSGTGTTAAQHFIESERNFALESIAASRKDPEKMRGPLSGRAMEYLDEDVADLFMELRSSYGDDGMLPLLRKVLQASRSQVDPKKISLQWPRLFQPTLQELSQIIPALAMAINPLNAQSKPGPEGAGPPPKPDPAYMLLTPEEAREWLHVQMDIGMLDAEVEELDEDVDEPEEPHPTDAPPRLDPGDAPGDDRAGPPAADAMPTPGEPRQVLP